MAIRLIREEDISECGRIYTEVFAAQPYSGSWNIDTASDMLSGLLLRDPDSCWCIEKGGKIAGFAFCTQFGTFRATIQEFAIDTKFQHMGFGRSLLEHTLSTFRERGLENVDLIANQDAPAFDMYRRFGFKQPSRYAVMAKWLL